MTSIDVNDVLKRTQSTANGSTTDFSFSFQVNNTNEIKVYEDSTLKTEGTHYDIVDSSASAGLNANGTGVVKFKTSPTDYTPANNKVITILSVMSIARASVYTSGGNLTASALEADYDRIHRILGDFKEVKSRTLIAPEYSATDADMTLPSKADRLGKILGFNASTGNPEVTFTVADGLTLASVSADIATLADIEDGTDATDAISTLAPKATQVGLLGNSTTVSNMNLLGVSGVITDMNLLGVSAVITDMDLLATSANITAMGHLGTSANVTAMGLLGTSDVVNDMALLAVQSVIDDMALLAVTDVIDDMAILGGSGVVGKVTTVANNISDVTTVADNISTISAKAPLASPALTGNPTAPTQSASDNSTKIATTAYVDNQVATENTIAEMDDVTITSIGDNEILQYDSTSSKFINQTLSEAGIQPTLTFGISDTNIPIFTSGVADDDFLRVNGTNIEGRSASEVASDIGAVSAGFAIAMAVAL